MLALNYNPISRELNENQTTHGETSFNEFILHAYHAPAYRNNIKYLWTTSLVCVPWNKGARIFIFKTTILILHTSAFLVPNPGRSSSPHRRRHRYCKATQLNVHCARCVTGMECDADRLSSLQLQLHCFYGMVYDNNYACIREICDGFWCIYTCTGCVSKMV